MIELECGNCGRVQQLEKAFAGCICRCRFCKAIQTVPSDPAGGRFLRRGPRLLHCPQAKRSLGAGIAWWRLIVLGVLGLALVGAVVVTFWTNSG